MTVIAKVVAEIGAVHLGQMERAKELASLAKLCGADYVKFQKRNPEESVPESIKHKPHPNQIFAYGPTYLEHRKALEFSIEQHLELMSYCQGIGIKYSSSVWDMTSAKEIVSLNPDFIKIPSACNQNFKILEYLLSNYKGDIHISTGMTFDHEKVRIFDYIKPYPGRFVVYHCTSLYPCPFDKLYLMNIRGMLKLANEYNFEVGFSNHGYGIAADIAAYVLGATFIERHFVDDRTIRHTDAAASLEPEGLRKLCRDLKNVAKAMEFSGPEPTAEEMIERAKLRIEE
jgi:N-acetylneuraminate synthase